MVSSVCCALSSTCVVTCVLVAAAVIRCCVWLAVDYSRVGDGFVLYDWPDHAWHLYLPRSPTSSCLLMTLVLCVNDYWHVCSSRVQCVGDQSLTWSLCLFTMLFVCVHCCCRAHLVWSGFASCVCVVWLCFLYSSELGLVRGCLAGFTSSFDSAYQAFYSMAIMAEATHNPIVSSTDCSAGT